MGPYLYIAMIKLKQLLCESSQLSSAKLASVIKSAYVSMFDIDDVEVIKSKELGAPSFAYTYMTVSVRIGYKNRQFLIYHKLFHYKFPKEETKGLSYSEWMDMLHYAEKFPPNITTDEMIKGNNPLIIFNASINDASQGAKITGFEMYKNLIHIGDVENKHNILTLLTEVKSIIDKYGDDSSEEEEEPFVPTPSVHNPKLVTV